MALSFPGKGGWNLQGQPRSQQCLWVSRLIQSMAGGFEQAFGKAKEAWIRFCIHALQYYWKRKHMGVVDSGITATVNAHRIVLQGPLWRLQAVFFLLFLFKAGSVSHSNFLNPLSSFSSQCFAQQTGSCCLCSMQGSAFHWTWPWSNNTQMWQKQLFPLPGKSLNLQASCAL